MSPIDTVLLALAASSHLMVILSLLLVIRRLVRQVCVLREQNAAYADRIYWQSELLSRNAEKHSQENVRQPADKHPLGESP